MSQIKAAVFDMDGVLINTEPMHFRMWKETFHRRGLEIEYDVYKGCIGTTHGFLMQLIYDNYGVDFREDKELSAEMMQIKKEMVAREGFPKMVGVEEMLKALKDSGYLLAIASSSPIPFIEMAMENIGVCDYFDVICSGDQVKHSKPAPDIYLLAADKLGVKPVECIVLEDSTNGVASACAAGMLAVGLYNPDSGVQNLEKAGCIIDKLTDFSPKLIQTLGE